MPKVAGPRKDLGTRYACFQCETKFYDLHRPVPTCPKCGADQREDPALKAPKPPPERPRRPPPRPKRPPRVVDDETEGGVSTDEDVDLDDTEISDDTDTEDSDEDLDDSEDL